MRYLQSAIGATPNRYNKCRFLAFPSAADLFDVQTSHSKMSIYPGLAPFAIRCRTFGAYFGLRQISVFKISASLRLCVLKSKFSESNFLVIVANFLENQATKLLLYDILNSSNLRYFSKFRTNILEISE